MDNNKMCGSDKALLIATIVITFFTAAFFIVLTVGMLQYSAHVRDVNLQKWVACHERPTYPCRTSDDAS